MKKIFALLIAVVTVLLLVSCDIAFTESTDDIKNTEENNQNPLENSDETPGENKNDNNTSTLPKLQGTLSHCTAFSEGLAFATIEGDEENVYCITPQKEVVFSVKKPEGHGLGWLSYNGSVSFVNGLAYLNGFFNGGLCDKTGKIIRPEDVGATMFYGDALKGGYILAEVTISDYASTTQKLGILNTNFEWIHEPTEALFQQVKPGSYLNITYFDDHLLIHTTNNVLNLKTAQIVDPISVHLPSDVWHLNYFGVFTDPISGNTVLDVSDTINMDICREFSFGTSVATYYNRTTLKYYFNLINEKGEFVFEPVEAPSRDWAFVARAQNVIVFKAGKTFYSYDNKGNLLGSVNMSTYNNNVAWNHCFISDDTIVIRGGLGGLPGMSIDLAYVFDKNLIEK